MPDKDPLQLDINIESPTTGAPGWFSDLAHLEDNWIHQTSPWTGARWEDGGGEPQVIRSGKDVIRHFARVKVPKGPEEDRKRPDVLNPNTALILQAVRIAGTPVDHSAKPIGPAESLAGPEKINQGIVLIPQSVWVRRLGGGIDDFIVLTGFQTMILGADTGTHLLALLFTHVFAGGRGWKFSVSTEPVSGLPIGSLITPPPVDSTGILLHGFDGTTKVGPAPPANPGLGLPAWGEAVQILNSVGTPPTLGIAQTAPQVQPLFDATSGASGIWSTLSGVQWTGAYYLVDGTQAIPGEFDGTKNLATIGIGSGIIHFDQFIDLTSGLVPLHDDRGIQLAIAAQPQPDPDERGTVTLYTERTVVLPDPDPPQVTPSFVLIWIPS